MTTKPYIDPSVAINEAGNQFFDFNTSKVQTLTIGQLERTVRENDIYGRPLQGIYHFELLRELEKMALLEGLKIEYDEIFAANGGASSNPGVVLLPEREAKFGERAVEAHTLRRVYANMVIRDFDTSELTTQLAVSFHQDGIQVGLGPQVRICHNLTMLGKKQYATTSGKDRLDIPTLLTTVRSWLNNADTHIRADQQQIQRMKQIPVTYQQNCMMLGALTIERVKHDTRHRPIRESRDYPLNSSQINRLTETLELLYHSANYGEISLWQWYNCATELHKPGRTDIPAIIPQNIALINFLNELV